MDGLVTIARQISALTYKNLVLAKRNYTSTFLRIFASLFFILLIYLCNEGIKARFSQESSVKDVPDPVPTEKHGIPDCIPKVEKGCVTFSYAPAPNNEFNPSKDYAAFSDFFTDLPQSLKDACPACQSANCLTDNVPSCQTCCEMFRVHKVVRGLMKHNGSSVSSKDVYPILPEKVVGFLNETEMDKFILKNMNYVQGSYVFYSPNNNTFTFLVQQNGTSADVVRGEWTSPYMEYTVPMQLVAHREIAKNVFLKDENFKVQIAIQEFAHPAFVVSTFEGQIAPLFLLACSMFPFVIQMNEIVAEKELKLRQVLSAMGLKDFSYWMSWHLFQSFMALLYSFLLVLFGMAFQFRLFLKNDFGILLITFWMFGQSMIGLAFLLGSFLRRAAQAVTVGFAVFLIAFIFYFVVVFGFPYGLYKGQAPFSYQYNITQGAYTVKSSGGDRAAEPLFSFFPPSLFVKNLADLGALTATDKDLGIRFSEAYSYCTINPNQCNPSYSVGTSWSWYIGLYVLYSLVGLYLENVLPDAMGVKKAPWYFLTPAYWGFTEAHIHDDPTFVIEESTDEDVLAEEASVKARANEEMKEEAAIEIRGLKQTFKRGGKPFHAVKAPWFAVAKNQLFALLGPNGAGKTTTINMLTGFLPPTAGNALVFGNTVAHPSGMNRVKRVIGICPQFDILWERLTAREHLIIFAIIKGIKPDSVYHEADKRIEEVRLNDAANQIAGSFSGGMKRRLSVAVSLIGNPSVVYLDEPTTGMDPINRRHVWDVIEAAKQDRCVVLTTHSMEEADILGDRIGIMAKGRLRCIGSSVRLKSRFGGGYRISVSCGDNMTKSLPHCIKIKEMFRKTFKVEVVEESKTYMHFNVPNTDDATLQSFFEQLESSRESLCIVDVQLSMSTLEDVFLNIAKQSEKEEALSMNRTANVTLKTGEVVGVLLGNEDELVSPAGVTFKVKWGTDEDGNLIAVDTEEKGGQSKSIMVTVPEGVRGGEQVEVQVEGQAFNVTVPEGAAPGSTFQAQVMVDTAPGLTSTSSETALVKLTEEELQERVEKLQTPFAQQANALFKKNLSLQSRKWVTNCCLLLVPIFFIAIILLLQLLLEIVFLGQPTVRCPYCGPSDDSFGKSYCNGKNCADYFFPASSKNDYIKKFGVDVNAQCVAVSKTCPGKGDPTCFLPQYAENTQFAFCPVDIGIKQPNLGYSTPDVFRSKNPILYTGTTDFASKVASKLIPKEEDTSAYMSSIESLTSSLMFSLFLMGKPPLKVGCSFDDLSPQQRSALCRIVQQAQGTDEPCCLDFTTPADISGSLRFGVNYWSDNVNHTDASFNSSLSTLMSEGKTSSQAIADIRQLWKQQGAIFADGKGKASFLLALSSDSVGKLMGPLSQYILLLSQGMTGFRCARPIPAGEEVGRQLGAELAKLRQADTCVSVDAGLAVMAKLTGMGGSLYPSITSFPVKVNNVEYYSDVEGRWAQQCDFYTQPLMSMLKTEKNLGLGSLALLNDIPCLCVGLQLVKLVIPALLLPANINLGGILMDLPASTTCSDPQTCRPDSPIGFFNNPSMRWATPIWPDTSFFIENALGSNPKFWWNQQHVLTAEQKASWKPVVNKCTQNCWEKNGTSSGLLNMLADDCSASSSRYCFFFQVANMSGIKTECISSRPSKVASLSQLNSQLYNGFFDRFSSKQQTITEYISAFDFRNSDEQLLNISIQYNDTTFPSSSGGGGPKNLVRILASVSAAIDAFLNAKLKPEGMQYAGSSMGVKEMPQSAWKLNLDLASSLGPFFFTLAFSLLFPTIVVSIVYEKEMKLRVIMRMMGLENGPYWVINYIFWFLIYVLFCFLMLLIASLAQLPSGYRIGLFTKQEPSVHFVFFFLFIHHTIAHAFLWTTVLRSARTSSICATLFVLGFSLIAWLCWGFGNFFNSLTVADSLRTFITIFPLWNFYRGLSEYYEYAYAASRSGGTGLTWAKMANDPRCGMPAVLIILAVEWVVFLIFTYYLDQVLDSGHGIPKHPLFFLGFKNPEHDASADLENSGRDMVPEDVKQEEKRIQELEGKDKAEHDAVMVHKLGKTYPSYMGNPPKVAVRSLTMGVQHGECFGMLGPNGAGKTTTINMLVGFTKPTHGEASVEGFSILSDMARVYTLMGVCPQHDILWETLTAREHVIFYGRLKNLKGHELNMAVNECLQQVNLLHVIDEKAGTFSGGMKRRLSVAISMIGNPLICYLDEPSTGLDPASRRTLWTCIKQAKKSRAIFLTTHSMEEAEGLCDRLGIFVDGELRCIGNPKELTSRFGGFYVVTVTCEHGHETEVSELVHSMAKDVRLTYAIAGTQKFEIPTDQLTLSKAFSTMSARREQLKILDWGIANTTLEEAFIKISKASHAN